MDGWQDGRMQMNVYFEVATHSGEDFVKGRKTERKRYVKSKNTLFEPQRMLIGFSSLSPSNKPLPHSTHR